MAAEAHFHKSCYRDYTRPRKAKLDKSISEGNVEYDAFGEFFEYLRSRVIGAQTVVTMVELVSKLESLMKLQLEMTMSARKHLRKKIETEFGSSLEIFRDEKRMLLVMPKNHDIKKIVKSKIV